MALEYSWKRRLDSKETPFLSKFSFLISFVFLLAFCFLAYYMPDVDWWWYDLITYFCIFMSFVITMFVAMVTICWWTGVMMTYNQMVALKLDEQIEILNELY